MAEVLTEYHADRLSKEIYSALDYAQFVSKDYPSRELSLVITKLQEAQLWMGCVPQELMF